MVTPFAPEVPVLLFVLVCLALGAGFTLLTRPAAPPTPQPWPARCEIVRLDAGREVLVCPLDRERAP